MARTLNKLSARPAAWAGMLILTALVLAVVIGPFVASHSPSATNYTKKLAPPQSGYWLGTDQFGRDVLARVLEGGRRSLGAASLVLAGVVCISLSLGLTAGMCGGLVDQAVTRTIDIILALPSLVFALAIVGVLGPGFENLVLAMIISHWASNTRLVRSFVLAAGNRPDVIAARQAGLNWFQIVRGHILPEAFSQLMVVVTLRLGDVIISISGLSFFGLGVQPPQAEWGAMLSQGRLFFTNAPWLLMAPAGGIFLTVLGANLLGEGIRDMLDPAMDQQER